MLRAVEVKRSQKTAPHSSIAQTIEQKRTSRGVISWKLSDMQIMNPKSLNALQQIF